MDRLMLSKNKRSRGDQSGNAPIPDSPNRKTNKNPIFIKDIMSFDDGAVGLGIVAAMSGGGGGGVCAPPARSEPIPIVSSRAGGYTLGSWEELSESYTCVISHARGNPVRKRVYFGDGSDGSFGKFVGNSGVFFQSPSPAAEISPAAVGFLSRCCLCKKKLQGLDIFMYRGEKAFCSEECRYQHIMSDQEREKWRLKPRNPIEYSVSPCSDSLFFAAGVAAA